MSNLLKTGVLVTLALALPQAIMAQTTVFSDNFGNGSTFNGVSTPTASSTSYDFDSTKTGAESISAGGLTFGLSSATTGGFVEAQAVFTSTPVTLATPGDYIDLTYTFTDTGNLLAGGTSTTGSIGSAIMTGLYNSGGVAPIAGTAGVSGNAVGLTSSTYPTGGSAGWQGYASRIQQSGGSQEAYTRPQQTAGTTSANQCLTGWPGLGSGAPANPAGAAVGSTLASTVTLTQGNQYTLDYRLTLSSPGVLTISDNLYAGVGTGGTDLSSQSSSTSSTLLTSSFDGLAIAIRNNGASLAPTMDINQITVSELTAVPEPNTFVLLGGGLVLLQGAWRRLQKRA
jgi:hypothetical protein